jgi:hypothetical protein
MENIYVKKINLWRSQEETPGGIFRVCYNYLPQQTVHFHIHNPGSPRFDGTQFTFRRNQL